MCAQDLSNAQGVNAPVAGSLMVWQPYADKDEGEQRWSTKLEQMMVQQQMEGQSKGQNNQVKSKCKLLC